MSFLERLSLLLWPTGRPPTERLLRVFRVLSFLQIVTIIRGTEASFPEPWSTEVLILAALFVVTGLGSARLMVSLHLFLLVFLISLHSLTMFFGRDGSMLVLITYTVLVLHCRTGLRREHKLVVATLLICLPLAESLLSIADRFVERARRGLPDYGDVMGEYQAGGFLRPNLDVRVVGENGDVRFITNEFGFRRRGPTPYVKPRGSFRILFIGDSFVSGYRVDQDDAVGTVLEQELGVLLKDLRVEVLVAGAGHPGAYLKYLERHAFRFQPDLILVGITLGNDIAQSYADRNRLSFEMAPLATTLLPQEAFKKDYCDMLPVRLDRSFSSWRLYGRLRALVWPEGIGSWYPDLPRYLHVFDGAHGLGYFYKWSNGDMVVRSFEDFELYLAGMNDMCLRNGVRFVAALIPQRFQISQREWEATVFRYGLHPAAFDLDRPNRRIAEICARHSVDCFDLVEAFRQNAEEDLYLPHTDMHWSARGHRLAGKTLARYVAPMTR